MESTLTLTSGTITVVDALIDGLRISDRTLNDKCLAALRSIGERAASHLRAAVYNRTTRGPHHGRLLDAIEMIENVGDIDGRAGFHVVEALFESLRVHNPQLNCKATAAIKCLPAGLVNRLITEAVCNHKKPGFCVRLLTAAEQLDTAPDFSRHLDLQFLSSRPNPKIREKAGQLLLKYGPFRTTK